MDFPIELIKMASHGGGGATDAVKYTEQTLTEQQQMQARKNLGLYCSESSGIVIEWDGDTTGRATFGVAGGSFYKVSDNVLSVSDFANATLTTPDGESSKIPPEYIQEMADGLVAGGGFIISARAGTYDIGIEITVPEDGVYFVLTEGMYVTRLEIVNETISKIDQKFIPDSIARADDVVKSYVFQDDFAPWDELLNAVNEFIDKGAIIKWDNNGVSWCKTWVSSQDQETYIEMIFEGEPYTVYTFKKKYAYGEYGADRLTPDSKFYNSSETGQAFFYDDNGESCGYILPDKEHLVMYGKFLFQKDGLILKASDDITKFFRITVDSSGTLSATEVTLDS